MRFRRRKPNVISHQRTQSQFVNTRRRVHAVNTAHEFWKGRGAQRARHIAGSSADRPWPAVPLWQLSCRRFLKDDTYPGVSQSFALRRLEMCQSATRVAPILAPLPCSCGVCALASSRPPLAWRASPHRRSHMTWAQPFPSRQSRASCGFSSSSYPPGAVGPGIANTAHGRPGFLHSS